MKITGIPADLALHSLTLTGDLTVGGGATVVGEMTSESVYETLNSDKTSGAPTEDMGFRARRGASPWWVVGWDETNDRTIIGTSTDGTVANTTGGAVVVGSVLAGAGAVGAPSISFSAAPTSGLYFSSVPIMAVGGAIAQTFGGDYFQINNSGARLLFSSDLTIARLAAASLRLGAAPSATPVAQTFTIGEASRPGTDTNVGGASGTIASGLGTGAGAASSLIFQTPTVGSTGSTVQSLATRLTVATAGITSTVPLIVPLGSAGAPSFTSAGDLTSGLYFESATNLTWSVAGVGRIRLASTGHVYAVGGFASGATLTGTDTFWTRHSTANWRQGVAASNDTDGVAQTLRSPGGGTVSSGTTGRAGGAYTIQAGDGSAAKASSGANGGVGGTLTLYGGAGGAGDGAGVAGAYGGVVVARAAGKLGFYDVTPIARAVLATGAGATVDDVITALQNLGLVKQL